MPVDPMLSEYSDLLFKGALTVYVLAMAFHAVEYVTSRARVRAVAAEAAPEPAAVGAAGGTGSTAGSGTADHGRVSEENADVPPPPVKASRPTRSRADRFGRMGVSLTILAVLLHFGSIVLRGLATVRWPLGNMYEFSSAVCLAAMVAWLVVLQRTSKRTRGLRKLGVFVLAPVLVLMFLAGTVLYAQAAPVVPALRSYWLSVHVTTVTLASGLFFVPGVASILYLMKRSGKPAGFVAKLPEADVLDRLAYRVTVVAFPMYTFAVIAGAIWAEAAWGRFWGWDPKETVAFVAWVIYAAYLHARATAGWRHVGAAWINILGLAAIIFNLFFINMVVAGLHSYAGLG
ncbi:c-type cytochrome biogenesis protein CcsB [Pseudonocardia kujensis]|uniref:c-type cytochrome biogenesis protein CcsB n=1 Tax=Pseudonocardia kujensis TaxID=1128675 RepID=UPI001E39E063|nr:c-type cytochrome biogenesis protein CcsB [Pseudonocardia kujensis]MCE0762699.1 c-type cytochrome biogenesis protein CcsB [Pseudonocardia kujensis]